MHSPAPSAHHLRCYLAAVFSSSSVFRCKTPLLNPTSCAKFPLSLFRLSEAHLPRLCVCAPTPPAFGRVRAQSDRACRASRGPSGRLPRPPRATRPAARRARRHRRARRRCARCAPLPRRRGCDMRHALTRTGACAHALYFRRSASQCTCTNRALTRALALGARARTFEVQARAPARCAGARAHRYVRVRRSRAHSLEHLLTQELGQKAGRAGIDGTWLRGLPRFPRGPF
eukprot:3368936-Pleurochrysis_carterae.AAC.1